MFDMDMDDNEEEEEDGEDIVVAASAGISGLMMASSPPVPPTLSPTPPAGSSTQVVAETPLGDDGLAFQRANRQVCLDDMEESGQHYHQHQHQKTRPSSSSSVGDGGLPRAADTDAHFAPFLREEKEEEEATTTRVRQLRQSRNALVETLERSTAHVNRLQARLLVYAGDKSALTEELGRARVEREEAMVGLLGRNRGGGRGAGFVTWGAVRDVTVFLVMGIGVLYSFWLWVNEPDFGYIRRRRAEVLCE